MILTAVPFEYPHTHLIYQVPRLGNILDDMEVRALIRRIIWLGVEVRPNSKSWTLYPR